MRHLSVTGILIFAVVSACVSADEMVELPRPQASYTAAASVQVPGSSRMQVDLQVRGETLRVEVPPEAMGSPHTTVFILDRPANSVMSFPSGANIAPGERFVLRMDLSKAGELGLSLPSAFPRGTVAGAARHLGEACTVYTARETAQSDSAYDACMTEDGILLHLREQGRADAIFELTALSRTQPAEGAFQAPQGYQVLDLSNAGGLMDMLKDFLGDK
jgi:hypothetical protein